MHPIEYAIIKNYPNPFNPETKIEFTMPETVQATLKVYDFIGEEVMTLFDGQAESDQYYEVKFNPEEAGLCTGFYYARLQCGDQHILVKMLYLKIDNRESIYSPSELFYDD